MDMPVDYHVWDAMLEHCQRHMVELANSMSSSKAVLSPIQNDLLHDY